MERVEKCYVAIKPGFANYLDVILEIQSRLVNAGLKITKVAFVIYNAKDAAEHYLNKKDEKYYQELINYMTSDRVCGMIVEGENAIKIVRGLVQRDKDAGLQEGDIRYDIPKMLNMKHDLTKNVIHASDCPEAAAKEIAIFENIIKRQKNIKPDNLIQL